MKNTRDSFELGSPKVRITDYFDLSEPAMGLELDGVTIGLMKSDYKDISIRYYDAERWVLSYYALRCMISEADAKALIDRGCKYDK